MAVAARMTRTNVETVESIFTMSIYMENPCESTGPLRLSTKGERCAPFPSHGSGASGSCSALTWRWIDRILAAWVNTSVWVEDCNQLQYTSLAGGTPFGLAGFTVGTIACNSLDSFLQGVLDFQVNVFLRW